MKKILAALLLLALLMGLTATAMAEDPELWLAGIKMEDGKYLYCKGTTPEIRNSKPTDNWAHWNSATRTLTLHNFRYEGENAMNRVLGIAFWTGVLNIELEAGTANQLYGTGASNGINVGSIVSVKGAGSLDVRSKGSTIAFGAHGISVKEANIRVQSENGEAIWLGGGSPYLTISSGSLEAKATGTGKVFPAQSVQFNLGEKIHGRGSLQSSDTDTVAFVASDRNKYKYVKFSEMTPEIYVGGVGMLSGEYLANSASAVTTTKPTTGGYAYYDSGKLTLNNYVYLGTGHAKALVYVPTASYTDIVLQGNNSLTSNVVNVLYGIHPNDGSIAISGSGSLELKTKGYGVDAEKITISGGKLNVEVGESGIRAEEGFSITDGSVKVTAAKDGISAKKVSISGGEVVVTGNNCGIWASSGVTVSGGEVDVTGDDYGIWASSGVTVSGGAVKASGITQQAVYNALNIGSGMAAKASEAYNGALGEYVKANLSTYKLIVVKAGATVTFDYDDGSTVTKQTVFKGETVTKPADPTRTGYTFKGWTLGGAAYDFTAAVTGDIALKAVWEKTVDIWVGGVGMASGEYLANGAAATTTSKPSGGYAYYKDGVLTLHDYSYTGKGTYIETAFGESHYAAIRLKNDVKIQLDEGTENTITGTSGGESKTLVDGISYGYDIEIAGNGKLTIYGENDGAELSYSNLTVNSGDVTISGGSSGASDPTEKITVNAGSLTIKSERLAFWAPHEFEVVLGAGITGIASESYDGSNPVAFDIDDAGDYKYVRFAKAKEYTVTVENGDGSGDYAAGETVTITAPDVSGKVFKEWTSADGVTFADKNAAVTTFTMPEKNVTVTPVYNTIISVIDLSGITPPVAGAMPDTSFTISTPGVDYGAEIFWSRYDEANNKLEQQYPDSTLVSNTPFRAGMYYKMQAEVWAEEGYIFTPDTVIRYDGVELPVKDDANLKPNFRYPVLAEQRDRTAASIGWAVAEEEPDEDKLYPVVITKVLKGISAKDLPEGTVFNFVVIDGNNGDTQESAVITREELIVGNGEASTTIMTQYKGGMRIGEEIASAQLSAYEWVGSVAVSGDVEYQEIDKAFDVKPFVCTGMIKPETGEAVVTYTNEYTPVKVDLPKTGDESDLVLWACAMILSSAAGVMLLRKKREA